jgi:hypothetical protein
MEDPLTKRRRFLQGVGVSGTALLAGCSGILDTQESDDETPEDDGSTDDGQDGTDGSDTDDGSSEDDSIERGDGDTREVGIVAEPDQQALQGLQQKVRSGELNQTQAVERQREIIQTAIDELKEILQSETDIEVNDEYPQLGAVLATGDPYELVDSLTSSKVSVLISPESLQTQQQPSG